MLALRVRQDEPAWLFWFRPERRRDVTWAGEVQKAFAREEGRLRLKPRASFAAFDEEQRGRADPWSIADMASARRMRESLVDVLLQLYATAAESANLDRVRVLRACEAASEPLGVVDASGRAVYVNPAWERLLGPLDLKLRADLQLSSAFLTPAVHQALVDVLEGRLRSFTCEADALAHDAASTPVRVLVKVDSVRTEGGSSAGAVVVATDLRERLRAEAERERMRSRLERADRVEALALVTGGVAHDFNNLLTGILCEATLLQEESLDAFQRGSAEQIERTARRAADLCRQLLAYSGKGTVVVERVDLVALIDDMLTVLRSIVPQAVQLVSRAPSRAVVVLGDATQLRQVVMNLVVNASDATKDASGVVEVSLGVESTTAAHVLEDSREPLAAGDYAVVRVRDHGVGIPEDRRSKIFEPFFSSKGAGKGLGLAGVLGIVRSHRGGIELESVVGEGTCFSVWLPQAPPLPGEAPLPSAAPRARGDRPCVLVVEDEEPARLVVCRILARDGYAVLSAATVAEARSILESEKTEICVVLTDFVLPDGTGAEVLTAASARDPELPVIVTSGYSHGFEPVNATPNLLGFLPKPFGRADISKIVGDGVRKYRLLRGVPDEA
jgi:signal transduction histidine kinase